MAAARAKGEGKLSTVRQIALVPMPDEPASVRKRRLRAQKKAGPLWAGTAAEQNVEAEARDRARGYERKRVMRAEQGSQIDRYRKRGSIDLPQFHAAEKLANLFAGSGLNPKLTANWDTTFGGNSGLPGMGPTAREYMLAMQAVGIILSPVLVHVVFQDQSAVSWAVALGKPQKDGMAALRLALDALCFHWRFKKPPHEWS
jgi:hypothetical protein